MIDKRLLNYLGDDKKLLIKIVVFHILNTITTISLTASLVAILYFSINYNLSNILYLIVGLLFLIILNVIFYRLSAKNKYELGNKVTTKIRNETYHSIMNASSFNITRSELTQLSIEGTEQLRLYYTMFIPFFFTSIISPIILFVIICFFSPLVATYYLLLVPLIPISIILVSKWAKRVFNKYWGIYLGLGNSFLDNIKGLKEIRNFNQKKNKQKSLDEESEKFRKITMKVLVMQLCSITIMDLVAFGGASGGIILTLKQMYAGLNPYISIFIILLGAEFFLPLRALGSAFHVAMNGKTAGNKLLDLKETPLREYKYEIDNITNLKLDNVTYKYDNVIVEDVNLVFNKGLYSLAGISGCGKSTIAKSIARRNNNYTGNILINGINILDITSESLYKKLCYIDNKSYIFNDSVRNNFKMHKKDITDDEIYKLLDKVNLSYLYKKNGLDYIINDSMTNISGGERQRLVLAMYLVNKYDLYIFDEVTSNVDRESEEVIINIIKELSKDSIVLLISHRLLNHKLANNIYFIENKIISESGNFHELLNVNGSFKSLYDKQLELEL